MHSLHFRRSVTGLTSVFLLSVAFAACGGGASSLPNSAQNPVGDNTAQAPTAVAPASSPAPASTTAPAASSASVTIHVTTSDRTAAASAKTGKGHIYLPSSNKLKTQSVVYPADLQYYGGKTITSARVYNAFVNSAAAAFGNPSSFEEHLSYSTMMHMTDEYVHSTAANRYDWAGDATVAYSVFTTLGDNDLLAIVHAVAKGLAGGGYNHMYHIFLPSGTNYCSTGTILPLGDCNASATSPNPAFCAFHDSVVFSDIGETIFTFEPFQDTTFCGVDNNTSTPTAPTPNGLQNDSTYSTLSHETFEAITDPDPFIPGLAWYDMNVGVNGEIGDLCAYIPQNVSLTAKLYRIQLEYSNAQHACNNTTP